MNKINMILKELGFEKDRIFTIKGYSGLVVCEKEYFPEIYDYLLDTFSLKSFDQRENCITFTTPPLFDEVTLKLYDTRRGLISDLQGHQYCSMILDYDTVTRHDQFSNSILYLNTRLRAVGTESTRMVIL